MEETHKGVLSSQEASALHHAIEDAIGVVKHGIKLVLGSLATAALERERLRHKLPQGGEVCAPCPPSSPMTCERRWSMEPWSVPSASCAPRKVLTYCATASALRGLWRASSSRKSTWLAILAATHSVTS